MFSAQIRGDKELRRSFRRIGNSKVLIAGVRRGLRSLAKPILEQARRRTPVESGRLRGSLGIASVRRGDRIIVEVGPRRTFRYTATGGTKMAVASTDNQRQAAERKQLRLDDSKPHFYAHGIEFGHDQSGRLRRRKGGARMLGGAVESLMPTLRREMPRALMSAVTDAARREALKNTRSR